MTVEVTEHNSEITVQITEGMVNFNNITISLTDPIAETYQLIKKNHPEMTDVEFLARVISSGLIIWGIDTVVQRIRYGGEEE